MQIYDSLYSEKHELEEILASIPSSNVIERASFEARLKRVKDGISKVVPPVPVKKAALTFRGDPVQGSRAIAAEFSSKITGLFNDAVAAIAAGLEENLQLKGKIPNKKERQLLITGTAVGSFGFEFEVPTSEKEHDFFQSSSPAAEALDRLLKFLEVTAAGDDEALAEVVDEIHPRAVKTIAEMLSYAAKERAWCALSFEGRSFRFRDLQQLEQAVDRVRDDNIREEEVELQGVFTGVLPKSRQFEFLSTDGAQDIKGRVSADVESTEELKPWIDKLVRVTFDKITVGTGLPKYTLTDLRSIVEVEPETPNFGEH